MKRPLATQRRVDVVGYLFGLLISMMAALLVVFATVNALSERILDTDGVSWSFRVLFGPSVFSGQSRQGWEQIASGPGWSAQAGRFNELLTTQLQTDIAFIASYAIFFVLIMVVICRAWWWSFATLPLLVLITVDVVEDFFARQLVEQADPMSPALLIGASTSIDILVLATTIKWIALIALIAVLSLRLLTQRGRTLSAINPKTLVRAWRAILHQRFSLVPSVVLLVLSVLSGAAILEQLPDVERSWANGSGLDPQGIAAVTALAMLTLSTYLTTRIRTGYARDQRIEDGPEDETTPAPTVPPAQLRIWLIPVAVVVLAAVGWVAGWVAESASGQDPTLNPPAWRRSVAFVGLPLVIITSSALIRAVWLKRLPGYEGPRYDRAGVAAVALVGNVATAAVVVAGGLGLIRAFIPIELLSDQFEADAPGRSLTVDLGQTRVWLILGMIMIVAPWLVAIISRLARPAYGRLTEVSPIRAGRVLLLGWLMIFAVLTVYPHLASGVGLAATAVLSVGALTGPLSAMGLLMQAQAPAAIFRALGSRRTPLITVSSLTLILVSALSSTGTIHQINRGGEITHVDLRPSLETEFARWVAADDGCEVEVGDRRVRPMLMVAAEGGGIRAAYWTVRGLEEIARNTCADKAALFSAGASGGSVGLTVARFSGTRADPGAVRAVEAVQQMAEESTLAAAADGTFLRDTFYGATGFPVPQLASTDPWTWADRASLIETGWTEAYDRRGVPWGSRSYLSDPDPSPATGALIVNSTSVKHTCRTWLSQLSFPPTAANPTPDSDPESTCDKVPGPAARTIDLFSTYGPYTGEPSGPSPIPGCLGDITAATAGLLTARFPYVTPGGVIGPCPDRGAENQSKAPSWPRTQLVDGGYVENSGLATITDLAPQWVALVRAHNALALDDASLPFVVPMVVYLANGDPGITRPTSNRGLVSEVSLPISTYLAGGRALSGSNALLERARSEVAIDKICSGPASGGADPCPQLAARFPRRVVVIDRLPEPEVSAPLGWSLSHASRITLNNAMEAQVQASCSVDPAGRPSETAPPVCRLGYAPLGDLRGYFTLS